MGPCADWRSHLQLLRRSVRSRLVVLVLKVLSGVERLLYTSRLRLLSHRR